LRNENILIVGSGNVVHNLRKIKWEPEPAPYDWAIEFDEWVKMKIEASDHRPLITLATTTEAGRLSIPTVEHYLPFLYILGAATPADNYRFEYEGLENGSISMRSISFGL
ncbi:MAG: class III extradiol ring-cleavage dioxygenase, partial [Bdellovibrionia bacterium]